MSKPPKPPIPDAAARRALERADRYGCAGCARPFNFGEIELMAKARGRDLSCYHLTCLPPGSKITAISTPVTDGSDPHTAGDREFFERNPGRSAYVRRPAPGELQLLANRGALSVLRSGQPADQVDTARQHIADVLGTYARHPDRVLILVGQVREGVRYRHPLCYAQSVRPEDFTAEEVEQEARAISAANDIDKQVGQEDHVDVVEGMVLPLQVAYAVINGTTSPLDVAQAQGERKSAVVH